MSVIPDTIIIEFTDTSRAAYELIRLTLERSGYSEIATETRTVHRVTASKPNEIIIVPPPHLLPGARGVDVSRHQGVIDWPTLINSSIVESNPSTGAVEQRYPVRFAFIRSSMGVPASHYSGRDDRFIENWRETGRLGELFRGVYHYWRWEPDQATQVQHLFDVTGGDFGNISLLPPTTDKPFWRAELYRGVEGQPKPRPVVDLEPAAGDVVTAAQRPAITAALKTFLDAIEARAGAKPIIYTSASAWATLTTQPAWANEYPLFAASYRQHPPTLPAGWATWAFWQYSSTGTIPGHESEHIDLDIFNGGWTPTAPPPTPGSQRWQALYSASVYPQASITASTRLGYLSVGQVVEESYPAGVERSAGWVRHTGLGVDKQGWTQEKQLQKA